MRLYCSLIDARIVSVVCYECNARVSHQSSSTFCSRVWYMAHSTAYNTVRIDTARGLILTCGIFYGGYSIFKRKNSTNLFVCWSFQFASKSLKYKRKCDKNALPTALGVDWRTAPFKIRVEFVWGEGPPPGDSGTERHEAGQGRGKEKMKKQEDGRCMRLLVDKRGLLRRPSVCYWMHVLYEMQMESGCVSWCKIANGAIAFRTVMMSTDVMSWWCCDVCCCRSANRSLCDVRWQSSSEIVWNLRMVSCRTRRSPVVSILSVCLSLSLSSCSSIAALSLLVCDCQKANNTSP